MKLELATTEAADFDPTLEEGADPGLATRFNEVIDRYVKMGGSVPPGFREALWSLCHEIDDLPSLAEVAPARLMFELAAQSERRRFAKRLRREEVPDDCLVCTQDEPCESCKQTVRIIAMLEAGT